MICIHSVTIGMRRFLVHFRHAIEVGRIAATGEKN